MTHSRNKTYQPRRPLRSVHGASTAQRDERPRRPIIRTFLVLLLLSLAGGVAAKLDWQSYIDKVGSMTEKPIRHVVIEGSFTHVDKETIQRQLSGLIDASFMDTDLLVLKQKLEQNPWIDRAILSRHWPDKLSVVIHEHVAIARWGDNGVINSQGVLIRPVNTDALLELPVLMGPESMHRKIVDTYLSLAQMFSSNQLALSGVYVDNSDAWRVSVDSSKETRMELVLGRGDILEKMKNFSLVYNAELKDKKHRIKRIDLRYDSAMAVQWYEQQSEQQANQATAKKQG